MSIWGDIAGAVISAGANIFGASQAAGAAEDAADLTARTTQQSINFLERKGEEGVGYLDEGYASGRGYLKSLLPNYQPHMLSPYQKLARERFVGTARENLAGSGLRGSGRAQSRILGDQIEQFDQNALEYNRERMAEGRQALGRLDVGEGQDKASIVTGQGAQGASVIQSGGSRQAGLLQDAGNIRGQGIISTGALAADTLGSILAENDKRSDPYAGFKWGD